MSGPFGDAPGPAGGLGSQAEAFRALVRRLELSGLAHDAAQAAAVEADPSGYRASVELAERRPRLDGARLLAALPSHVRITGGAARVL